MLGGAGFISGLAFAPFVPPFIDESVTAVSGVIKAIHVSELRTRIDAVRARYGKPAYAYTASVLTPGAAVVRAADIEELRAAIGEIYALIGIPPPSYTDAALTPGIVVKAAHINELRAAVLNIE